MAPLYHGLEGKPPIAAEQGTRARWSDSGDDPAGQDWIFQPVQERSILLADKSARFPLCTHLGTDCGPMASGMWYSLAGLAQDKDNCLDFTHCYPFVRAEYQASCVGVTLRVRASGSLTLELKSPNGGVLWWAICDLPAGDDWQELAFSWSPTDLRAVKSLNWMLDPEAQPCVDHIRLHIAFPPSLAFGERVFLLSYAKVARCYSPGEGTVRDRAHMPAGVSESIPATGLFCLATCAAWKMGMVKRASAEQILHKTYAAVSRLPRAKGLLPYFIQRHGERHEIRAGAKHSTLGTSLYYHGMLLAAQMLWDAETLAGLTTAVREIEFDQLRDAEGHVLEGLEDDGRTPLAASWREWGGETALVLLLQRMVMGDRAALEMEGSGKVRDGVGYVAEIQSLFYPDFSSDEPDAVSGVNWLRARRSLLAEQKGYSADRWPKSVAARAGLYGLSAGEGPGGAGYEENGTRTRERSELIHPHYVLMSGLLEPDPNAVYSVLRVMEERGLLPPWGMVESFTKDLDAYLPVFGSLHGAFECISAYHLWARATGGTDHIYEAVEDCGLLREAVRAFYPPTTHW